ncbi:MAG: hypothetical protein K8T10_18990 [Candidatus Eremiobacteraeota bacterium]|nr:hypothetical protein [Candidatus Eremiobacteraeota bacterium]
MKKTAFISFIIIIFIFTTIALFSPEISRAQKLNENVNSQISSSLGVVDSSVKLGDYNQIASAILKDRGKPQESPSPEKKPDEESPSPKSPEKKEASPTPDSSKKSPTPKKDVKDGDKNKDEASPAPAPKRTKFTPKTLKPVPKPKAGKETPKPKPAKKSPTPKPIKKTPKPVPKPKKTVMPSPTPSLEKTPVRKPVTPKPLKTPVVKKTPKPIAPKTLKPKPKKPRKHFSTKSYKRTHWDKFARHVRFTVHQEMKIKQLLLKERDQIMNARSSAAEKILKILNDKQEAKWDGLYQKFDKLGDKGDYKKRLLLNPEYLKTIFSLSDSQRKILFYISWDYARRVDKIRTRTTKKIQKILMADQFKKWESAVKSRIGSPGKF